MCLDITEIYYCPHQRISQTRRVCPDRGRPEANPHGHQPAIDPERIRQASARFLASEQPIEGEDDHASDDDMSDDDDYEYPLLPCSRIQRQTIPNPTRCERCKGPVYDGGNEKLLLEAGFPAELLIHYESPREEDLDPQLYADQPSRSDADVPPRYHLIRTQPPIRYDTIEQNPMLPIDWMEDINDFATAWRALWEAPLRSFYERRQCLTQLRGLSPQDRIAATHINGWLHYLENADRVIAERSPRAREIQRRYNGYMARVSKPPSRTEIMRIRATRNAMYSIWIESIEGLNLIQHYQYNVIPVMLQQVRMLPRPEVRRFHRNEYGEIGAEIFAPPLAFPSNETDAFPAWIRTEPVPDVPFLLAIEAPPPYEHDIEMGDS